MTEQTVEKHNEVDPLVGIEFKTQKKSKVLPEPTETLTSKYQHCAIIAYWRYDRYKHFYECVYHIVVPNPIGRIVSQDLSNQIKKVIFCGHDDSLFLFFKQEDDPHFEKNYSIAYIDRDYKQRVTVRQRA